MNVKRLFNMGMVFVMLVTSMIVYQPAEAKAPAKISQSPLADAKFVPGEVVVVFADSQGKNLIGKIEQAVETAQEQGGEVTRLSMDGTAVIQVDGDPVAVANELTQEPDVLYAEPNYIFSLPTSEAASEEGFKLNSEYLLRHVTPSASTNGNTIMAVPKSTIQSMMALGVYPNDTYLTDNQGWAWVGGDIVWPNTTASANVCMIDTGVDSGHPDLSYTYSYTVGRRRRATTVYVTVSRVLSGYDFVNADTSPTDDNGHGTHTAGLVAAMGNNGLGISGISTGNIVPVKALDAQGVGTNFDIAAAIAYCANRTDVSVLNLSLGSTSPSNLIYDALLYATTPVGSNVPPVGGAIGGSGTYAGQPGKGKLAVAAAGNQGNNTPIYPAAYAAESEFTNTVLAVGASGREDIIFGVTIINYECRAPFSNYGSWVSVVAPGNDIYSLTPWDKPFYQNYYKGVTTRLGYMDGTSMAAAYVSASAARRMGYKPLETNAQIGADVLSMGVPLDVTGGCWDATMSGKVQVNVAKLLDRAAIRARVYDAASGSPLFNSTVSAFGGTASAYTGSSNYGSSVVPSVSYTLPFEDPDPNRVFMNFQPEADILNLPVKDTLGVDLKYTVAVNMSGYTSGNQFAFQHESEKILPAGEFTVFENGAVPPTSANFDVSLGWLVWQQPTFEKANGPFDLDVYLWLPQTSPGQPAPFIVGYDGDAFGYLENDSYGTLNAFPFARLKREGGYLDGGPTVETVSILPNPSNTALPYYSNAYNILATDYGQTIDHDNDGCGDNYGASYNSAYTPGPECSGKTLGIALLGAYYTPYVYVWRNGVVSYFQNGANNFSYWPAEIEPAENTNSCNDHWWKAFSLNGTTGAYAAYGTPTLPLCDDGASPSFIPYTAYANPPGDRINLLNK